MWGLALVNLILVFVPILTVQLPRLYPHWLSDSIDVPEPRADARSKTQPQQAIRRRGPRRTLDGNFTCDGSGREAASSCANPSNDGMISYRIEGFDTQVQNRQEGTNKGSTISTGDRRAATRAGQIGTASGDFPLEGAPESEDEKTLWTSHDGGDKPYRSHGRGDGRIRWGGLRGRRGWGRALRRGLTTDTRKPWDPPFPTSESKDRPPYLILPEICTSEPPNKTATLSPSPNALTPSDTDYLAEHQVATSHIASAIPTGDGSCKTGSSSEAAISAQSTNPTGSEFRFSTLQWLFLALGFLIFILLFAVLVAHSLAWFIVYKTEARLGEVRKGLLRGGDMRICLCAGR